MDELLPEYSPSSALVKSLLVYPSVYHSNTSKYKYYRLLRSFFCLSFFLLLTYRPHSARYTISNVWLWEIESRGTVPVPEGSTFTRTLASDSIWRKNRKLEPKHKETVWVSLITLLKRSWQSDGKNDYIDYYYYFYWTTLSSRSNKQQHFI